MADDTRAQIQIGADTAALEAGVTRAKKSLADLGATANAAGQQATTGLGGIDDELKRGGLSAKAYANALRQVGPQFTDIFTGLAAGQKPLTVLLQQGGQLKDVFGGVAPAARALTGYIVGLINPLTVAAGAAAAVAYAFNEGAKESSQFVKAIALSGNVSGVTAGQLQAMAKGMTSVTGSQAEASAALAEFAQNGQVAGASLQKFATIALQTQRNTGQSIAETAKNFAELARSPVEASVKLNEALHYLTLGSYAQIKAFQDQGRQADAAATAQTAYGQALLGQNAQIERSLGSLEQAFRSVSEVAKGFWSSLLNVGRSEGLQTQLAAVQGRLTNLGENGALMARGGRRQSTLNGEREELQETARAISRRIVLEQDLASAARAAAEQVQARIGFDKAGEEFMTKQAKAEREISKARNEGAAAGASQVEIEKRVADIREKFADKGAIKAGLAIDRAQLASDLAAYRSASEQFVNTVQNRERLLDAQRSAGLLGDQEYYARKRDLIIEQNEVAEYYLQQEIARAQKEQSTLSGKDGIDNLRRIRELQEALAKLGANTATSLGINATQAQAAAASLTASFLSARQAAQEFFDTLQLQQNRSLDFGQGNATRDFNAGLNQITDRYASERRKLENDRDLAIVASDEGKLTDAQEREFARRLRLIEEFQDKASDSYKVWYAKRQAQDADASLGAQEAVRNYLDEIGKTGKATQEAVGQSLHTLEDELTNLLTGKGFDAKRLVDQIISEFLRLQVIRPIMQEALGGSGGSGGWLSALMGLFGGGAGVGINNTGTSLPTAGGAATGSNFVERDMLTILHKGEAVIPKAYNPAAGGKGGGDVVIHQENHFGSNVSRAEVVQAVAAGNAQLKADLARARSRGTGVFQ